MDPVKIFLISSLFVVLFSINCDSSTEDEIFETSVNGVLQNTTIMIFTYDTASKSSSQSDRDECYVKRIVSPPACLERKVPLSIWTEMEQIMSNYTSFGGGKEPFCFINENKQEPGVPFEAGAKVEITSTAPNDCQRVLLMRPGTPPLKLPTSLIKVKVLDGKDKGLEGWTWTGAVVRD